MAKDAVDAAVATCSLRPRNESLTDGLLLEGGHGWTPNMFIRLTQDFGLDDEVCTVEAIYPCHNSLLYPFRGLCFGD